MRGKKGDRTRKQLYDCAIQLFREQGYDQVTVDEIVKKAGMAKGTFYIYFRSKSDVIMEMLRHYDDYYDRIMEDAAGLSCYEKLEAVIRGSCRFTRDVIGLDVIRVLYTNHLIKGKEHQGLLNEDRRLFQIILLLVQEGQEQGIYSCRWNAEELTLLILRGIRSVFFEWCSSGGNLDLTEQCMLFLRVFCRGMLCVE